MSPAYRKALAKFLRQFGGWPEALTYDMKFIQREAFAEGYIQGYNDSNLMNAKKAKVKK